MPHRVLIIDDSPLMHRLLAAQIIDEDCTVRGALGPDEGLAQACAEPPDLILLDLVMQGGDGFDVLKRLKADPRTNDVPVIVISATANVREKVRALDLGATDYIVKPFDRAELRARVRAALRTKRHTDFLTERSTVDGLTGLWNRAHFDRRLAEEIAGARRYRRRFALVLADIDQFKSVNDNFGHATGDRMLAAVAEVLQRSVRTEDAACRFGGEEFALLLVESGREEAASVALRVRERVAAMSILVNAEPLARTISLGAVASDDFAAAQLAPTTVIEAADRALYAAKNGGRNRLCLAPPRTVTASLPIVAAAQ